MERIYSLHKYSPLVFRTKTQLWFYGKSNCLLQAIKTYFFKATAVEAFTEAVHQLHLTVTDDILLNHKLIVIMATASCHMCIPRTTHLPWTSWTELKKQVLIDTDIRPYSAPSSYKHDGMHITSSLQNEVQIVEIKMNGEEKGSKRRTKENSKRTENGNGIKCRYACLRNGTTNNGNAANPQVVTGVSTDLIYRISVLLRALNSGQDSNLVKYNEYSKMTTEHFVDLYPRFYMPASLHTMLMHGGQIIEELCIPVGLLQQREWRQLTK